MARTIDRFTGSKYGFLSNFYPCLVTFQFETYISVEHGYQAAKTTDENQRRAIRDCATPGEAKRLGRRVTLRSDWEQIKLSTMRQLLRQKFMEPKLRALLLETADAELIEGNDWGDRFWGVCRLEGQNWLGRLLMQVRQEIMDAQDH